MLRVCFYRFTKAQDKVHLLRVRLCLEDQRHQGVQSGPVKRTETQMSHRTSLYRHVCLRKVGTYGMVEIHTSDWLCV